MTKNLSTNLAIFNVSYLFEYEYFYLGDYLKKNKKF